MSFRCAAFVFGFLLASLQPAQAQEVESQGEPAHREFLARSAGLGFLDRKTAEQEVYRRSKNMQYYSALDTRGEDGLDDLILEGNHQITSALLSFEGPKSTHPDYDVYAKIRLIRRAATKSLYRSMLDLRSLNIQIETELEGRQRMRAELAESIWFSDVETLGKTAQPLVRTILKSHQDYYRLAVLPVAQGLATIHQCDLDSLIMDIPHDSAIIEIVQFHKTVDTATRPVPHYDAFVVRPDANPEIQQNFLSPARPIRRAHRENVIRIPLGPCDAIDKLIAEWRNEIANGAASSEAANELSSRYTSKIAKHLQATKRIYIVADGDFHNCPWSAMPLQNGKYWLEEFEIAELPFAEYLLQAVQFTAIDSVSGYSGLNQALVVGGVAEDLLYSNTISDLLNAELPQNSVVCLQGDEATVQHVVEELPRSLIAHFDTHGIYAASAYDRARKLKVFQSETPQNAMHFSALQLAEPMEDCNLNTSILAAYLLSELDLSSLELAVLAACESSMGNDRFGEGRFSLGRALHLAGCRDVIGSLWKVDDFATSQLMIAFYKSLLQGKTATESLRSAQLAILNGNIPVAVASSQRSPLNKDRKTTIEAARTQQSPGVPIRHWAGFQLSGPGDRPLASRLQGKD